MSPSEEELKVDVSNVSLSDINDHEFSLSSFKGKPLILSGGGGMAAMEEAKKWRKALEKEYGARKDLKYVELAFIGKLPPFFPKQFIKNNIMKDVMKEGFPTPPLIDWDGNAAKILGVTKPDLCYVFVIDKQGFLRYKLVEKYSEKGLSKVKAQVEKLI